MKTIKILAFALCALTAATVRAHDKNMPLNAGLKSFMAQYEAVRAALAADDLPAAQKAAGAIVATVAAQPPAEAAAAQHLDYVAAAKDIAEAASLDKAREAFMALSKRALHLADGQKGYYVVHCKMFAASEGNWVQTSPKVSNPYLGQSMPSCGTLQK
ncbi:MAG TPA: DUF3347 domain-containing protein [Bryobacteraceae bacterium]|nr:DUF3347 domain-containing protein [Bryobacteraceae bacterium]